MHLFWLDFPGEKIMLRGRDLFLWFCLVKTWCVNAENMMADIKTELEENSSYKRMWWIESWEMKHWCTAFGSWLSIKSSVLHLIRFDKLKKNGEEGECFNCCWKLIETFGRSDGKWLMLIDPVWSIIAA